MGRVKQLYNLFGDGQGGWSAGYEVSRTYNLAGAVASQKYPSGHTVNYGYDMGGRSVSLAGNLGDGLQRTYVSAIDYGPWGTVTRERLGTNAPVFNKLHYNIRGQLCDVRISNLNDEWGGELGALVNHYSTNNVPCGSGSDNNGNVLMSQTILNSYYIEDRYGYDSLNRLTSVHEYSNGATLTGTQQYDYDRWGNRTIKPVSTVGLNKQFTVKTVTNQLDVPSGQSGELTYDNAGNLIRDTYTGTGDRVYDADNHMVAAQDNVSGWSYYTYNADGQRVRRRINNQEMWQIYGIDGELVAEYSASSPVTTPQKEYGYRNGQLLVTAANGNVALASSGATVTASSTLSPYVAANVIDGSRRAVNGTGWLDNTFNSFPDWIEISFNGSKTISEIDVITQQDDPQNPVEPTLSQTFNLYGITSFDVQYWNGSTWTTVPGGSVTGNNKVWRQFSFAPITTSKIRVVVSAGADNAFSRVVEVEAWANGSSGSSSNIQWLVSDHLGTPRLIIDQTGTLANIKRHDYLPFGEEIWAGTSGRTAAMGYGAGDLVRQQFTAKERDVETGLGFFEARYYSSIQGRFTSPDDFLNDTHVHDPASWNLYTYVRNNPLKLVDPTGEVVNGAGLTDAERQQLIDDWQRKTGYNRIYFDNNNNLVIDKSAGISKDANGKFLGSADARANLTDAIETKDVFNLEHANGSRQVAFADNQLTQTTTNAQTNQTFRTYRVRIDFNDFNHARGDREAIEANSIGLVALHEFDHNLYGQLTDTPNGPNNPGPVEANYINPIREQLGLAQRATYSAVPVGGALRNAYRGYVQVRYTLNGRDKILRWQDTIVGGVHH
jgi:RHS repeat-associated protein